MSVKMLPWTGFDGVMTSIVLEGKTRLKFFKVSVQFLSTALGYEGSQLRAKV